MEEGYRMDSVRTVRLLMSSLSVYRGVNDRSASKAFYRLLCAEDASPDEFVSAWGAFYSLLAERGYTENFLYCMTKAALFDENAFSRACCAKKDGELPKGLADAARRDIDAIFRIGRTTPQDILGAYRRADELGEAADLLPRWSVGKSVPELSGSDPMSGLSQYYQANGFGTFARYRAFIWRDKSLYPVQYPDSITISSLTGYEIPRAKVVDNTTAFLHGCGCNNVLLYGDRGTGKSSTVKAILNEYWGDGLRMVEMPKDKLAEFPLLVERIAPLPLKFIIFIDDLSFNEDDKSYAWLKAVLEGGLAVRPDNTLIYATSNRRHLNKENFSDRSGDELHRNDTIQETLSLSDRFGLSVLFGKPDKAQYIDIIKNLAQEKGIAFDEELLAQAESFAISRGGRSPRCARQFIAAHEAAALNKNE